MVLDIMQVILFMQTFNCFKNGGKEMEEKILALLTEEYPEIDFTASEELVDDGILDSLTITGIIATLTMEFDITIPYEEIVEKNFNSIAGMARMVEKLQG